MTIKTYRYIVHSAFYVVKFRYFYTKIRQQLHILAFIIYTEMITAEKRNSMSFCYEYPRPAVTVDIALITNHPSNCILLIKRGNEPFKDCWALPGGFVDENEDLEHAAIRELKEETGIKDLRLNQYRTYGTPGRDPRGHTVSVVYRAILPEPIDAIGHDDATEAKWFEFTNLPQLAFDHQIIINDLLKTYKSSPDSNSSS